MDTADPYRRQDSLKFLDKQYQYDYQFVESGELDMKIEKQIVLLSKGWWWWQAHIKGHAWGTLSA
jgi:hypothetical protein